MKIDLKDILLNTDKNQSIREQVSEFNDLMSEMYLCTSDKKHKYMNIDLKNAAYNARVELSKQLIRPSHQMHSTTIVINNVFVLKKNQ